MDNTIKRRSLEVMFFFLFILIPVTVQADPNNTADPQLIRVAKVITIEIPSSAKGEVPPRKAKSPSTPNETPEQKFMRAVLETPRARDLDSGKPLPDCNKYTRPCFSISW